jgi:ABC-2 type transport system permease protein
MWDMKYKMSFFNKGVLTNDLKRFSWMGILYSLFLIFVLPFQIIMIHSNNTKDYKVSMEHIFDAGNGMLPFPIFIVPVIVALFLFRYLQNKNSVDMLHSLPIKRVTLYDSHVFFGVMTLVIPVIITTIISCILKSTLNLNDLGIHFTYNQIFAWCGTTILFSIFIFLFSVLIGMVTGLSTAQGILTYIFLLLPAGLGFLIIENLNMYLFGFNLSGSILEKFSLFRIDGISYNPLTITEIVIYILLSIFICALARFVYVKRDLEAATNAVAFKTLQPIFKYGVTFCCTLVGGIYLKNAQNSLLCTIFGYYIAGLIGYYVAEMIIKKSIKVFKNVKGYLIYAGIFSVILLCVNFDIMGYEKRIPAITEIQSIRFIDGNYSYNHELNDKDCLYYEKDNLENIKSLHNKIIESKKNTKNKNGRFNGFTINYNLKNGKEIERQYYLPNELVKDYLKPIYESSEYKKINFDILKVNVSKVDKITISPSIGSKNLTLTNPTEIKEVVDILKTVTLNNTYEEMQDIRQPWGQIDLLLSNDERINLSFSKTNKELEKWLLAKNYLKNARIMPEDIGYILVTKRVNGRIDDVNGAEVKPLKIEDKIKIETCLQNSCEENNIENIYNIDYFVEIVPITAGLGRYQTIFDQNHAPDFVKEYFK